MLKKALKWLGGDLIKDITSLVDETFTSKEELEEKKNEIISKVIEQEKELNRIQASIILAEAKGNFLQRSWRPILMLSFGFVVLYSKFIAPAFSLPNATLEPQFWNLLQLGIGGYVVGRSFEKISKTVMENIKLKK